MASKVYFIDFRATFQENLMEKIKRLAKTAGLDDIIAKNELAAIKLHFGELGNTAHIKPVFVGTIVEAVKETGANPFLTDTNTLYAGARSSSPDHLTTAVKNGFAYSVVGAPVVIADGLRGKSDTVTKINQKNFDEVYIASDIHHADSMVSLAHFKGHELSGFGGALKNLGMGCSSRRGKLAMHSTVSPKIKAKKCIACKECIRHCPADAITLNEKKKAVINRDTCIGCGECIVVCPTEAVQIQWNQKVPVFLEKLVEYSYGAVQNKKDKVLYINFINNVSPLCDCIGHNDTPIVRDIGIVASTDPVAIDQASFDLVNKEAAFTDSCLKTNTAPGEDKFNGMYPYGDWEAQLKYAEELGMGTRAYELEHLETIGLKDKDEKPAEEAR